MFKNLLFILNCFYTTDKKVLELFYLIFLFAKWNGYFYYVPFSWTTWVFTNTCTFIFQMLLHIFLSMIFETTPSIFHTFSLFTVLAIILRVWRLYITCMRQIHSRIQILSLSHVILILALINKSLNRKVKIFRTRIALEIFTQENGYQTANQCWRIGIILIDILRIQQWSHWSTIENFMKKIF